MQGLQHFETRQNAIVAIEFSPGRLRVEVTAGRHRTALGVESCASRKHIPDGIHPQFAADFAGPG